MAGMEEFGRHLFQEGHLPVATALRVGVDGPVWVVERHELDVPYVVVYHLEPG